MFAACKELGLPAIIETIQQPDWKRMDLALIGFYPVVRILAGYKADVIHANDPLTARSIAFAAWLCRIPVVCHVRFGRMSSEMLNWVFRGLPSPSAFIFNSQFLQQEVGQVLARKCTKSIQAIIDNAVDLRRFCVNGVRPTGRLRIGILANLIPLKGHEDFLEMAAELTRRNVDAEYWIVGEDIHNTGYRKVLDDRTAELGLVDRIRFLGFRSDVPAILNELDIVVCTSHYEPFGRCVVEAMACGRPVVATNVGGIPEIIEDQVTGVLVPPMAPNMVNAAVN